YGFFQLHHSEAAESFGGSYFDNVFAVPLLRLVSFAWLLLLFPVPDEFQERQLLPVFREIHVCCALQPQRNEPDGIPVESPKESHPQAGLLFCRHRNQRNGLLRVCPLSLSTCLPGYYSTHPGDF